MHAKKVLQLVEKKGEQKGVNKDVKKDVKKDALKWQNECSLTEWR